MSATLAAPKRLTPDDLLALPGGGRGYELIDGELKGRTVSKESGRVGIRICGQLLEYGDPGRGWVFGPDVGFRCFPDHPDRVRKADAAFISLARMPVETYEDEGFCALAPDLVAEVVSPNDLTWEVEAKRDEWLAAGVREVWIINPEARTVHVHRAGGGYAFLRVADTLTAPGVLPGFAAPVADLFRRPGESAPV